MSSGTNNIASTAARSARQLLRKKKPRGSARLALTSVAIAREVSRHCDTRSGDRPLVREPTRIRFRGGERETTLINLSWAGAMIESSLAPNIAETILLDLGDGMLEGAVRWVKDGRIGLEFSSEAQVQSKMQNRRRRRETLTSFHESSGRDNSARRSARETESAVRPFLSHSGEAIEGSHRWTACLRNFSASELPAKFPAKFRLSSEAMLDLSSSGMIRATISWSTGKRVGRMH